MEKWDGLCSPAGSGCLLWITSTLLPGAAGTNSQCRSTFLKVSLLRVVFSSCSDVGSGVWKGSVLGLCPRLFSHPSSDAAPAWRSRPAGEVTQGSC